MLLERPLLLLYHPHHPGKVDHLPVTAEEGEEENGSEAQFIAHELISAVINVLTLASFFLEFRVRSLYPYAGQRAEELRMFPLSRVVLPLNI